MNTLLTQLLLWAVSIKNQTQPLANTHTIVGGLLEQIVIYLESLLSKINNISIGMIYRPPVATVADLTTTYPDAVVGWSAIVTSDGYIYQFDGTKWNNTGLKSFPEDVATKTELATKLDNTYKLGNSLSQTVLFGKMVRAVFTTGKVLTASQSLRITYFGLNSPSFQSYPFGIQIALVENGVVSKQTHYIYPSNVDLKNNAVLKLTAIAPTVLADEGLQVYVVLSNQYESLISTSFDSTVVNLTQEGYNWYLNPLVKKYIDTSISNLNNSLNTTIEATATGGNTYKVIIQHGDVDVFKKYIGEIYITGLDNRLNRRFELRYFGLKNGAFGNAPIGLQIAARKADDSGWEVAANYALNGTLTAGNQYKMTTTDPNAIAGMDVYVKLASTYQTPVTSVLYFIGAYVQLTPLSWNNFVPFAVKRYVDTSLGEYKATVITVQRNAQDYNSIRETIAALTPDFYNRYIVFVPKGRWFECDLTGKEYVEIVGADMLETVLYIDGNSTNVTPVDYSFSLHANKPLNTVPQDMKHIFNARLNPYASNLTLEANDAKYCIHLDYSLYTKAVFKNCRMTALSGVNYPVGIGIYGGQELQFLNCEFKRSTSGLGVFAHNWNNQKTPAKIHIENSKFTSCGYILVDELGSDQNDEFNLINCYSDAGGEVQWMVDAMNTQTTFWTNPATGQKEPNPQNVPYCIKVNSSGSNVTSVYSQKFPYGTQPISRPDCLNSMITEYYTEWNTTKTVSVGDCIQGYDDGGVHYYDKYIGTAPFVGVVRAIKGNKVYIIKKGNIVLTPVVGAAPSAAQHVKINANGRLEFTSDNNEPFVGIYVGYAVDNYKVALFR